MENIYKDAVIKMERLEKEFLELPETVIVGVVGASGPGAGRNPKDKYWNLSFSLIAWKELGGELHQSPLLLSKKVTDDELREVQIRVKKESLVQFNVKLSKVSPFGDARAQLISVLDAPDEVDLKAALEKFKEPVEITHPEFGTLTLDKSVDWFDGTVNWLGDSIRVSVSIDDDAGSPEGSLRTLEALCGDARNWSKKITDYAVSSLLELKNDNWLMEDQHELTETDFINAMRLDSITVHPDGEFEFWHDDGDLFLGHSILISGSLQDGPTDADIPG